MSPSVSAWGVVRLRSSQLGEGGNIHRERTGCFSNPPGVCFFRQHVLFFFFSGESCTVTKKKEKKRNKPPLLDAAIPTAPLSHWCAVSPPSLLSPPPPPPPLSSPPSSLISQIVGDLLQSRCCSSEPLLHRDSWLNEKDMLAFVLVSGSLWIILGESCSSWFFPPIALSMIHRRAPVWGRRTCCLAGDGWMEPLCVSFIAGLYFLYLPFTKALGVCAFTSLSIHPIGLLICAQRLELALCCLAP